MRSSRTGAKIEKSSSSRACFHLGWASEVFREVGDQVAGDAGGAFVLAADLADDRRLFVREVGVGEVVEPIGDLLVGQQVVSDRRHR